MFESIFTDGTVDAAGFFIVLGVALVCGVIFAFLSCYKSDSSSSFLVCVSFLPMTVAAVIAIVNGNLGVGVAIAGAFGLVRFRSAPGSAREIAIVFISMAAGLAFGSGYLAYGAIFLLASGILLFAAAQISKKANALKNKEKRINITIPESLDYTTVFDDIFSEYTVSSVLEKVKTINMGSMFRLSYRVTLKNPDCEKAMLDEIRIRNGNLEVQCSRTDSMEKDL